MMSTAMKTATCVEPDVDRADDLDAFRWHEATINDNASPTSKAGFGVTAVSAFFFWTPEEESASPVEFMVTEYSEAMGHTQEGDGIDVVLRDLITDLWHLGAAYGIRLDGTHRPEDSLALDLRLVLLEIRDAARGLWADELGVALEEIEADAYQAYLADCSAS